MAKCWVNTVSRDHVRGGVEGGFTQAGHGESSGLKRLRTGDWLVFYSPKTSLPRRRAAAGRSPRWVVSPTRTCIKVEMASGFVPWRRNVEFVECAEAPIRPLIDELTFIRDKQRWGYVFRRGLFEIPCEDLELIKRAMAAGA